MCVKLGNNPYAKGTTAGYARTGTDSLDVKIRFKFTTDSKGEALMYDGDTSDNRNFLMYKLTSSTNEINLYLYDEAGNANIFTSPSTLKDTWYAWHIVYDGVNLTITDIDTGSAIAQWDYSGGVRIMPNSLLILGAGKNDGSFQFSGYLSCLHYCGMEYNLAEGGLSDSLYSATVGDKLTFYSATLSDVWSSRQDKKHYNIKRGFDMWENGTAGEEIRVPIGVAVTQSGYTYSDTYQPGKWHNNAETGINIPSDYSDIVTSAGIPQPLYYDNFETDFNNKHYAFSSIKDKKHGYICLYDTAKTADEVTKILKCFKKAHNDVFTYDSNGDVIVDSNGYPVTTN